MKIEVFQFLKQLYKQDKKLFSAILLYGCGILYYCFHQREEFPFLLYGMYSRREEPKQFYTGYILEIDSQQVSLSPLNDSKRELINTTITNADGLYSKGQLSRLDQSGLNHWLYAIYKSTAISRNRAADVYRITCSYKKNGEPVVLKKELLFADD